MNPSHYTRYSKRKYNRRDDITMSDRVQGYMILVVIAIIINVIASHPIYESIIVALS